MRNGKLRTIARSTMKEVRIKLSAKRGKDEVKKRRKTLRHLRKSYIDSAEDKE